MNPTNLEAREIKFRAWDKKSKLMFGWDVEEISHWLEFYETYQVMQYTGLKDKNGKEIHQ